MKRLLMTLLLAASLCSCSAINQPAPSTAPQDRAEQSSASAEPGTSSSTSSSTSSGTSSGTSSAASSAASSEPDTRLLNDVTCEKALFTPPRKPESEELPTACLAWADSETLLLMECSGSVTDFYLLDAGSLELKASYSQPFQAGKIVNRLSDGWILRDTAWFDTCEYYLVDNSFRLLAQTVLPEQKDDHIIHSVVVNRDFSRQAYDEGMPIKAEDGSITGYTHTVVLADIDGSNKRILYSDSYSYPDRELDFDWWPPGTKYPLCFSEDGGTILCGTISSGLGEPEASGGMLNVNTGEMTQFKTYTEDDEDDYASWRIPIGLVPGRSDKVLTCGAGTAIEAIGVGIYDLEKKQGHSFTGWTGFGYRYKRYHGTDISEPYMFGEYELERNRSARFIFDIEAEQRIDFIDYMRYPAELDTMNNQAMAISPKHDRFAEISPATGGGYNILMFTLPDAPNK